MYACTYASDRGVDADPSSSCRTGAQNLFLTEGGLWGDGEAEAYARAAHLHDADAGGEEEATKHEARAPPPPQALLPCASSTTRAVILHEERDSGVRGRGGDEAAVGRACC